jgi:hypothetical protein
LADEPSVRAIILEGGGAIADVWVKPARHRTIPIQLITAEQWRADALLPRDQRRGYIAKKAAITSARQQINDHATKRTKALRDDTAEAIMVGEWALERISELFPTLNEGREPNDR